MKCKPAGNTPELLRFFPIPVYAANDAGITDMVACFVKKSKVKISRQAE
jgi:hypothetical protein